MQRDYYECHVTFMEPAFTCPVDPPQFWRYSRIDGDPVLGDGVKSYLTRQYSTRHKEEDVIAGVEEAAQWLRENGREVLRTKVELVVYDSKQLPDELIT